MIRRLLARILDNSLLLVLGAAAALVWANVASASYTRTAEALRFPVNDIGMVFFFALMTKEVVEAALPGGALSSVREAAAPVFAAVGGMILPAAIYGVGARVMGRPDLTRGWAIPCATDVAFAYLVARAIFPKGHPAIPFLLLLAIADDALGLMVLAVFYPAGSVSWLALIAWMAPAVALAWLLRRLRVQNFWPYVCGPAALSWCALHFGGLHPALAMVPIVPFMPRAAAYIGLFDPAELQRPDTLDVFARAWHVPVQVVLLLFGLVNAGVSWGGASPVTWLVFLSLLAGKPLGIVLFTRLSETGGLRRAAGFDGRALLLVGLMAGMGFTVSLFFATAAFPAGPVQDAAKAGALVSVAAGLVALGVAKLWKMDRASPGMN